MMRSRSYAKGDFCISEYFRKKPKSFLSPLIAGFISIFLLNAPVYGDAGIPKKENSIGESFDGEEFVYTIGFWWFKNAAVGKIGIRKLVHEGSNLGKENDVYEIILTAETRGFIGFVTGYRKDIYRTYAEEVAGGKRLRTKRFEKIVKIGNTTKESYTDVDYSARTYHWKSWKDGKEEKEATELIPPGVFYDDPLAGFYNFRFGVYGAIEEGKEFHVPTFPAKGASSIYVKIATAKEKNERVNPEPELVSYLADIVIAKELFGSQTGKVEVCFNKELIPVKATAKDLVLFGDVRGTLTEMTKSVGFVKNFSP